MAYFHTSLASNLKAALQDNLDKLKALFASTSLFKADDVITYKVVSNDHIVTVRLDHGYTQMCYIKLQEVGGCCGALTLYGWAVYAPYNKRGLGTALLKLCEEVAIRSKYSFLLATDHTRRKSAYNILRKNGWTVIRRFRSDRSHNIIWVFCKVVHPKQKSIYKG